MSPHCVSWVQHLVDVKRLAWVIIVGVPIWKGKDCIEAMSRVLCNGGRHGVDFAFGSLLKAR